MKIHFIGIGGIGTSAIARIMQSQGHEISGSDLEQTTLTKDLVRGGIKIFPRQEASNITEDIDLIIFTEAIDQEVNPEFQRAQELGLILKSYREALGIISKEKKTIAVVGSHGKTTVTALLINIFLEAGEDFSALLGGKMEELGGANFRVGKGDYFLAEACEYKENFSEIRPVAAVLTNVEVDHLDYYRDEDHYKGAFSKFLSQVDKKGFVVLNMDDQNSQEVSEKVSCRKVTYSLKKKADYWGPKKGFGKFTLYQGSDCLGDISLNIPGEHNIYNALAAAACALEVQIPFEAVKRGLEKFGGSWRRLEYRGSLNKAPVFDDYGHHPTQVKATLKALKEKYPKKKLICVYQPHQYSRTKYFLEKFGKAFLEADEVIVPNIYCVRDSGKDLEDISPERLVAEISKWHPNCRERKGFEETIRYLREAASEDDLVVVMGAGDVYKITEELIGKK
ncbi:MAG TPA: UDP-N-acetylmuramate--L-alanine ligase [Candidatus Atribacteria bacterium]|nr:UDP-N-acetylmuramate--L-alanine ligase [Candidatus Atribacteria bacterium]